MRAIWNILFIMVLALLLGYGGDAALAQDTSNFVVDGNPRDWLSGLRNFDRRHDVAPDSNNSIDIREYGVEYGGPFSRDGANGKELHKLFSFIFKFFEPPFRDSIQTSVELFFDVSADSTFGEATPPWVNFLPDYRIEIVGQNGRLTKEVYRRWGGDQWVVTEGEDLSEVEVALSGQWLEGAIPWAALGNPGDSEEERKRGYYFKWAVKTTQDGSHDYLPDEDWNPAGGFSTAVEPQSWGSIKNNQSQGGLD